MRNEQIPEKALWEKRLSYCVPSSLKLCLQVVWITAVGTFVNILGNWKFDLKKIKHLYNCEEIKRSTNCLIPTVALSTTKSGLVSYHQRLATNPWGWVQSESVCGCKRFCVYQATIIIYLFFSWKGFCLEKKTGVNIFLPFSYQFSTWEKNYKPFIVSYVLNLSPNNLTCFLI